MPDTSQPMTRPVELLAPAGDEASLRAAVRAGADAVYLGLAEFNARRSAANFTLESLAEACDYAHLRGVKVYVTVNTLVLPHEVGAALELVDDAWTAGCDAVIVQDLGLMREIRSELPEVRIHASTQINAHNAQTIQTLGALGAARVTLARELCIDEISGLSGHGAETEVFAHGALCACYSGQCLFSSMVGGRSANRGLCAQPCRLKYEVLRDGAREATSGPHVLSPKDLASIELLPRLISTGVAALKIEGRMKSPEYVAIVTSIYRSAIDRALSDPEGYRVTDGDMGALEEAFSRGFTSEYLEGGSGPAMMATSRPSDRGVLVGRVSRVEPDAAWVKLDRAIEQGDRIDFWTGSGRLSQTVEDMRLDDGSRAPAAPADASVRLPTLKSPALGDRVFRVENASLLGAARRLAFGRDEPRPVGIDVSVEVVTGQPLKMVLSSSAAKVVVEGEVVEAARTKPITAAEVAEHVGRLGGTPYEVGEWDVAIDPTAGIGYSALHSIRRRAIEEYERRLLAPWASREAARPHLAEPPVHARSGTIELVAVVRDEDAARACTEAGADRVLVLADGRQKSSGVLLPRIARDSEIDSLAEAAQGAKIASTGNLGLLARLAKTGLKCEADIGLNATNSAAVRVLADMGADLVWLSLELTGEQVGYVAARADVPVGIVVYGSVELMVLEHCVASQMGDCSGECGRCARRGGKWEIVDGKGFAFPFWIDSAGRTHVHNSRVLDLAKALPAIVGSGVAAVRADLVLEDSHEAAAATAALRAALDKAVAGDARESESIAGERATTGHYFRGVR